MTQRNGNGADWGWVDGKRRKVERRVWKGIPDRWRGAAWGVLIEEKVKRNKNGSGTNQEMDAGGGKGGRPSSDEELVKDYRVSGLRVVIGECVYSESRPFALFNVRLDIGKD